MSPRKDLTGHRFGKLTVLEFSHVNERKKAVWNCICECGCACEVYTYLLSSGKKKSCGCLLIERARNMNRTHGMSGTPEHQAWKRMNSRCHNKNSEDYKHYGGRGIENKFSSFEDFFSALGAMPSPDHTLERKDVNGHYEPNNCVWATWNDQRTNRRNSKKLTYKGLTLTVSEWSTKLGIADGTIRGRLNRGWSACRALETPESLTNTRLQKLERATRYASTES